MVKNFSRKDIFEITFIFSMLLLVIMFIIGFISDPTGSQAQIFFLKTKDFMGDFFNVIKYTADQNPYVNTLNGLGEKPYLPLAYVIMYFVGLTSDFKIGDIGINSQGYLIAALFVSLSSSIFFVQLFDHKNGKKWIKFLSVFMMFFSGLFLFSFERNNLIFISAILVMFFLVNYKSSNKITKEIAYICLAISAALKVYPALFGILLIYDKQYKEAMRLVLYGVLFSFLPFLFFEGGFANLPQWISNVGANSIAYRFTVFPRFGYALLLNWALANNIFEKATVVKINFVFSMLLYLSVVVFLFINKYQKTTWRKIGLLVVMVLLLPINSAFYNGLYLFIVIVLFLNDEHKRSWDYVYLFLFILILNPFQLVIGRLNFTMASINIAVTLLYILLLGDLLRDFIALKIKPKT